MSGVGVLLGFVIYALWKATSGKGKPRALIYSWYLLVWVLLWPWVGLAVIIVMDEMSLDPATLTGFAVLNAGPIVLLFPWPLARSCTIPLGLVRTTWILGFLANLTWRRDPAGGALAAALLARRRRRSARPQLDAWLRRRLEKLKMFRGGGALACALLSDLDGDVEAARTQMRAVLDFNPLVCPRIAYRLASDYLMLEAAARGDWHGAYGWARNRGLRRLTRLALFISGAAARLLGEEKTSSSLESPRGDRAPGDFGLWLRWLLAPRRRSTRALLERARAVPRGANEATATSPEPLTDQGDTPLDRALALHVACFRRDAPGHGLAEVAAAWQEVLDAPELPWRLTDVVDPDAAWVALTASVESALGELVDHGVPTSGEIESALLINALEDVIEPRQSELEFAAEALAERVEAEDPIPMSREFSEWCALRGLYERIHKVGGPAARRRAYSRMLHGVSPQSVRLFNELRQRPLANAIFYQLCEEAQATGHESAAEQMAHNLRCGL